MRRGLLIFVILLLAFAVANFVVAILASQTNSRVRLPPVANLFGAEAAAAGWPAPPPLVWPAVSQRDESAAFACRHFNALSVDGSTTTHQMEVSEFGWPLPVLRRVQLWWPWDDPKWSTPVPPDSGLQLTWTGSIVNPLLMATAVWVLLFVPLSLWRGFQRRRRRALGQCLTCAYPLGTASACPECGASVVQQQR